MGVIPARKDFKNFTYEDYLDFTEKVESTLGYTKVTHTPYNAKNHFDKFGYLNCGRKIVIVYDTKARIMSITAGDSEMKKLKPLAKVCAKTKAPKKADKASEKGQNEQSHKSSADSQSERKAKQPEKNAQKPTAGKTKADKSSNRVTEAPLADKKAKEQAKTQAKKPEAAQKKREKEEKAIADRAKKEIEKKKKLQEQEAKKRAAQQEKQARKEQQAQQKKEKRKQQEKASKKEQAASIVTLSGEKPSGSYLLMKDCYPLTFTKAFHRIRNTPELNINTLKTLNFGKAEQVDRYEVVKNGRVSEVRYVKSSGMLEVFGEVIDDVKPVFLSFGAVEVVDTRAQQKTPSSPYSNVLEQFIPTAIQYLSEQEIADFGAGYDELENAKQHYEYSMFLLSPFKALENFIFDLQKSQGIVVKLIGQAYDKDETGTYQLKECYRNKCGVVFSEVMSALYCEYYATRNHYTHSGDGEAHQIKTKQEALKVVGRIFAVVEYNCKKLKEINYKITR